MSQFTDPSQLYTDIILDHNENPRHYGHLRDATISAEDSNPLCGDKIFFDLKFDQKNTVTDIAFTAQGCAISKAAASMLCEWAAGKKKTDLEKLTQKEILKMIGIPLSPARMKCGLLGFYILKKALTLHKLSKSL